MYDARRRLQASPDDAWEAVSATDQIDWSDADWLSLGEVPWGLGVGGWVRVSCADTQINTNCIKDTKGLQVFCPWSPPRGGARDQSSLIDGACCPREKSARSITGREMKALGKELCPASLLSFTEMASTDFNKISPARRLPLYAHSFLAPSANVGVLVLIFRTAKVSCGVTSAVDNMIAELHCAPCLFAWSRAW